MSQGNTLSQRDSAILEYIFNPLIESPAVASVCQKTDVVEENVEGDIAGWDPAVVSEIKKKEVEAVLQAKKGDVKEALEILTNIINKHNNYASAYNNRAQVYRLLSENDKARADLDKAIELSDPSGSEPINKKVAKQAYAQRGFLQKLHAENEEAAIADLTKAAALGDTHSQLEINPFKALCSQMVSVMMKEQCGIDI